MYLSHFITRPLVSLTINLSTFIYTYLLTIYLPIYYLFSLSSHLSLICLSVLFVCLSVCLPTVFLPHYPSTWCLFQHKGDSSRAKRGRTITKSPKHYSVTNKTHPSTFPFVSTPASKFVFALVCLQIYPDFYLTFSVSQFAACLFLPASYSPVCQSTFPPDSLPALPPVPASIGGGNKQSKNSELLTTGQ